jgi:hypothetical protein
MLGRGSAARRVNAAASSGAQGQVSAIRSRVRRAERVRRARDVQDAVAQFLRFGEREFAVQEQDLGPGEQIDTDQGQFQPGLVDREHAGGESAEAGGLAGADAVFNERSSLHR